MGVREGEGGACVSVYVRARGYARAACIRAS